MNLNFEILDSKTCTQKQIGKLESRLNVSFPTDYREFLKNHNGGFCRNSGIFLDGQWRDVSWFEPITENGLEEGVRITQDGAIPDELSTSVVIGHAPRNQICLCCAGDLAGTVWYNEFHFNEFASVAKTFSEFINGIRPLPAEETVYWTKAAREPWIFCETDDRERISDSLGNNFSVDQVDSDSERPLTMLAIAAASGRRALSKQLLAAGSSPNFAGYQGYTSVHMAAWISGSTDILKLLADAGGDVNQQSEKGNTPIYLCAMNKGSTDVFQWLLKNGADAKLKNDSNESALSVLREMKRSKDYEWNWKPKLDLLS